jgi:DNA-binding IclR family transcriptional regulator
LDFDFWLLEIGGAMSKGQRIEKQDLSGAREKRGTQAIERALKILCCFNFSRSVWDATELSRELGLTLPTTKRILRALEEKGILSLNGRTGFYEVGLRVFELGALAFSRISLVNQSKELLIRLREETHQTVHLAVVDNEEVLYIKKMESSDVFGATSPDGLRRPLATGSLGKAILSTYPQVMLKAYLSNHRLVAYTSRSITDPKSYMEEISRVREQGFAVDQEELIDGVCGVAASITAGEGPAIGGIAIAFPALRFDEVRAMEWGQLVRQAGLTVSHRLSTLEEDLTPSRRLSRAEGIPHTNRREKA